MSDHFADPVPARGPYIFPAFQNQLWLPQARFSRPASPAESQMSPYQSASVSGVSEGPRVENSSNDTSTKGRSPNWSDAEIRFLIETWKDHHPISKRQNYFRNGLKPYARTRTVASQEPKRFSFYEIFSVTEESTHLFFSSCF